MAVTENQLLEIRRPGGLNPGKVAASKRLYANTLAFYASGYISDVAGGAAFAGINKDEVDNSAGSAGDESTELITEGVVYLLGTGFSQATVGVDIYASDNYTVTVTSTSNTKIGRCVDFVSATKIGVAIDAIQA